MRGRSEPLLIAYHRPGSPGWAARVERLAGLVSAAVGRSVEPVVFEDAVGRDAVVAALLLTRGGHWASVSRSARRASIVPGYVAAAAIARRAEGTASHLVLVAHRARRHVGEQLEDLDRLRGLLETAGFTVTALVAGMGEELGVDIRGGDCMVFPLVFFEGRFAATARALSERTGCTYAGVFMEYGFWDLYQWLISFFTYSTTAT